MSHCWKVPNFQWKNWSTIQITHCPLSSNKTQSSNLPSWKTVSHSSKFCCTVANHTPFLFRFTSCCYSTLVLTLLLTFFQWKGTRSEAVTWSWLSLERTATWHENSQVSIPCTHSCVPFNPNKHHNGKILQFRWISNKCSLTHESYNWWFPEDFGLTVILIYPCLDYVGPTNHCFCVTSTLTTYLTPNARLSTPRLRYCVPKINTYSWAAW